MVNEVDKYNTPDIFGKHGWFYKLERIPKSDSVAVAEVILWHEDSLELALEDDGDDDMDLDLDLNEEKEVEVKEEAITRDSVVEAPSMSVSQFRNSIIDRLVEGTFDSGLEISDDDDN